MKRNSKKMNELRKRIGSKVDVGYGVTPSLGNNYNVLVEAQRCWDGLQVAREERKRNRRYLFGDQYGDKIIDPDSKKQITEEEYIRNQGRVPLKQNLIHRLVKAVMGQYRSNQTEPICIARNRNDQKLGEMMSGVIQYNYQLNKLKELDARSMMEFLISGSVFTREDWDWKHDKMDVWTSMVNFNRVFFDNKMEDPRGWDIQLIGEIHDISMRKLLGKFAKDEADALRLREMYRMASDHNHLYNLAQNLSTYKLDNISFLTPSEPGMCRVIEVWKLESKERYRCHDRLTGDYYKIEINELNNIAQENVRRLKDDTAMGVLVEDIKFIETEWFVDEFWYYRFLSPLGDVLMEGETPFDHKSHPYAFKLYPFVDGQCKSFVSDVIDQQRYINRLVTQADFQQSVAAKGVLMVAEDHLGDYTPEQFAAQWTKSNGMLIYKPKPGIDPPKQVYANSIPAGTFEFINLQFKYMEDISGAHASLQGSAPNSGTSGVLFAQQTQNATNNLIDILDSFKSWVEDRDTKKLKMILQFYDDKMQLNTISNGSSRLIVYDARKARNVEWGIAISESQNTPVARMMSNELLMNLFDKNAITVEQLLENGTFAFADNLLQSIRSMKQEQMEAAANGVGMPQQGVA